MAETYRFALMGNPNVGKSSLFNALTGLHQHTGNWPGKTVATAAGTCSIDGAAVELIDLPGTYSLSARSPEEEVAAEYISFGCADAVIVVCDATALERNLYLALQVMEITDHVVICVNLMDEAQKQGIRLDLAALSFELGVPVVAVSAGREEGMQELLEQNGYEIVPFKEGADVYIINTCSVTNIADRKSRQMLHRAVWA